MKHIVKSESWSSIFKKYSVWALLAIVVASVAEALLALYTPPDAWHAVASGFATGILGILGIALRNWSQRPNSIKPKRRADPQ
jgi:hypothetical protein